jgi:uncharacterized protein YjbI with pentapeptide repeats
MQETLFTFLIPALISILAVILQKTEMDSTGENRHHDMLIAQLQRETDEEQIRTLGNETVFSNYIKNMADVILSSSTKMGNQHYIVTRALTITVLRRLDLEKKRLVILFLYDSGIIHRGGDIFAVNSPADPPKHLNGAVLNNIHCDGGLDLSAILLRSVTLINASFSNSDLHESDFSNSILNGVNFSGANLDGTKFIDSQLQQSNFTGASVKNIQLTRANLTRSTITDEQFSQALFVYNTILPNGIYARNKSFITNGNARQGTYGWNITSGLIEVKDFYFTGKNNAKMLQRINTTDARYYGSHEIFQYCISLFFYGQENLMIQLVHFDKNQDILRVENFIESKSLTGVCLG